MRRMAIGLTLATALLTAATPCLAGDGGVASAARARALAASAKAFAEGTPDRAESARAAARWAFRAATEFLASRDRAEGQWKPIEEALARASEVCGPQFSVADVPYVRQTNPSLCAVACALMGLRFVGIPASEDELLEMAGPRARADGIHVSRLADFVAHYGARALIGEGSEHLVRCSIAAGRPILVYQYAALDNDVEHMRVITGFDDARKVYSCWDPAPDLGPSREIPYADFDKLWSIPFREDGASHWLCVIYRGAEGGTMP